MDLSQYNTEGVAVIRDFLPFEMVNTIDRYLAGRTKNSKDLFNISFFRSLALHSCISDLAKSIIGEDLQLHHVNGQSLPPGFSVKPWHHDYDCDESDIDSNVAMIHFMIYPLGAGTKSGPLVVVPHSFRKRVRRDLPNVFGVMEMGGELVLDLAPTDLAVMHSRTWHCRRASTEQCSRPYMNISYCGKGIRRPERQRLVDYYRRLNGISDPLI